jgi:hypothetical protein
MDNFLGKTVSTASYEGLVVAQTKNAGTMIIVIDCDPGWTLDRSRVHSDYYLCIDNIEEYFGRRCWAVSTINATIKGPNITDWPE